MDNESIRRTMARLAWIITEPVPPGLCDRIRADINMRIARASRVRTHARADRMMIEAGTDSDEHGAEAQREARAMCHDGLGVHLNMQTASPGNDPLGGCGVRQVGDRVVFTAFYPQAREVSLAGSFNHWSPTATPMRCRGGGRSWQAEIRLPVGVYEYRFVVDGQWQEDPHNKWKTENHFGGYNSLVKITCCATRRIGVESLQMVGAGAV